METKEVKIGENAFKIRELNFLDELDFIDKHGTEGFKMRDILNLCVEEPKITDELLKSLKPKEGHQLLNEINKLNGWLGKDFPEPLKTK